LKQRGSLAEVRWRLPREDEGQGGTEMATKRTKQSRKSGKGLKKGKKLEGTKAPVTFKFTPVLVKNIPISDHS